MDRLGDSENGEAEEMANMIKSLLPSRSGPVSHAENGDDRETEDESSSLQAPPVRNHP